MSIQRKRRMTAQDRRKRRHVRVRKKIWGTAERPRLVVFRSLSSIEGQVVDDDSSSTVVGLSSLCKELASFKAESSQVNVEKARIAGKMLGEKAVAAGVESVVFDRGGYKYHGRVQAFAEGAREGGLKF